MLRHKIALVTGGGTGIGKAIGLQMAKNRAKVAIGSRSRSHLATAAAEFESLGLSVLPISMDVRKKLDVQRAIDEIVSKWGAIHILVNNAGISGLSRIDDPDDSKWFNIVDTNLNGMYLITKEVLKQMPDHNGGRGHQHFVGAGEIWGPRLHRLLHNQTWHDWVHALARVGSR